MKCIFPYSKNNSAVRIDTYLFSRTSEPVTELEPRSIVEARARAVMQCHVITRDMPHADMPRCGLLEDIDREY